MKKRSWCQGTKRRASLWNNYFLQIFYSDLNVWNKFPEVGVEVALNGEEKISIQAKIIKGLFCGTPCALKNKTSQHILKGIIVQFFLLLFGCGTPTMGKRGRGRMLRRKIGKGKVEKRTLLKGKYGTRDERNLYSLLGFSRRIGGIMRPGVGRKVGGLAKEEKKIQLTLFEGGITNLQRGKLGKRGWGLLKPSEEII